MGGRRYLPAPMLRFGGFRSWVTTHSGGSGNRAEHPDGRWFSGRCPHRKQQAVKFGHEERSPRPGNRRNACNAPICAPFGVEHIEESFAATDVDAAALG